MLVGPPADTDYVNAAQHLARAAKFASKGEEQYHKAAEEILAAKAADPTLSNRKIAEAVGRNHTWVGRLLKWYAAGSPASTTPFAEPERTRTSGAGRTTENGDREDEGEGDFRYYTPPEVIALAREVLGDIDLDPATDEIANEVVDARREIFTLESDPPALEREWKGREWMNPPYTTTDDGESVAGLFVEKLVDEYKHGNVTAAIVLVNGRMFSNRWFRPLFRYSVCWTRASARIRFWWPDDLDQVQPFVAPAIVYLGPEPEKFKRVFDPALGDVMEKGDFYVPAAEDFPIPWSAAGEDR